MHGREREEHRNGSGVVSGYLLFGLGQGIVCGFLNFRNGNESADARKLGQAKLCLGLNRFKD